MTTASPGRRWSRRRTIPQCATQGCNQPHQPNGRFCEQHTAQLARIRTELQTEATRRIGGGKKKLGSTCCTVGCASPRVPPAAFCDACHDAGAVQEDE